MICEDALAWLLVMVSATSHPDHHQLAEKHIDSEGQQLALLDQELKSSHQGILEHYSRNPSLFHSSRCTGPKGFLLFPLENS